MMELDVYELSKAVCKTCNFINIICIVWLIKTVLVGIYNFIKYTFKRVMVDIIKDVAKENGVETKDPSE